MAMWKWSEDVNLEANTSQETTVIVKPERMWAAASLQTAGKKALWTPKSSFVPFYILSISLAEVQSNQDHTPF